MPQLVCAPTGVHQTGVFPNWCVPPDWCVPQLVYSLTGACCEAAIAVNTSTGLLWVVFLYMCVSVCLDGGGGRGGGVEGGDVRDFL